MILSMGIIRSDDSEKKNMDKLKGLQPERVMYYFEAISSLQMEQPSVQTMALQSL